MTPATDRVRPTIGPGDDALGPSIERDAPMLDQLPLAVFARRMDGVVVYANAGASELLERPLDEVVGARLLDFFHPDDAEEGARVAAAPTTRHAVETRLVTGTGAVRWVRSSRHRSTLDGEDVWVVAMHDISIEKAAQQELAASERRIRSVVEALEEGLVVQSTSGAVLSANRSAERMLGLTHDQLMGRRPPDPGWRITDEEGRPLAAEHDLGATALRTGQPVRDVLLGVVHGSGERRWIRGSASPLSAPGFEGVFSVFTDITESRQVEQALANSESHFRLLTEHATDVVLSVDVDGRVAYASPSIASLGHRADDVLGTDVTALVVDDDRARVRALLQEILGGAARGDKARAEIRFSVAGGDPRWFDVQAVGLRDDRGAVHRVNHFARDVHDRKIAEAELARSEAQFRLVADQARMGIFTMRLDGSQTFVNEAYCRINGTSPADEVGRHWLHAVHPDDVDAVRRTWEATFAGRDECSVEFRIQRPDGEVRTVLVTATRIRGADGEWSHLGTVADISRQRAVEQRLSHDATHDPLTQLPNRVRLRELLDQALGQRAAGDGPIALLFIDLDHFKPVNDTHGHTVGDHVLVEVAERLTAALRAADTAARFGGDEFVVILDAPVTFVEADAVARRILAVLHVPFAIDDRLIGVGASIGLALSWDGATAEQLLTVADRAAYDAKHAGGGTVAHARPD